MLLLFTGVGARLRQGRDVGFYNGFSPRGAFCLARPARHQERASLLLVGSAAHVGDRRPYYEFAFATWTRFHSLGR